ncbi:uridylate-specific endoribonuclease B-like [Branchiostoma lanceolatum]|uniref:uridylate-specific endoribonuclease B-like n=1 Tax=Branchiostoma lanceolatum TaxID=7740 RepID=UPI00345385B0
MDSEETLSDVCSKLWELDTNRFKEGRDYEIKLQDSGKGAKLFSYVDEKKLVNIPTYKAFRELLNNYEADTSVPEKETPRKENKNLAFLGRCLETDVMKKAYSFLLSKDLVLQGYKQAFKKKLYELWFELHSRPTKDGCDVSAFEHTFVGETRRGQVIGFHNWVRLYEEERQGTVIYRGCKPHACNDRIITIDFTWNKNNKTHGSFFLGTSPEFELAIYTVCFLARPAKKCIETAVILGNNSAKIITKPVNFKSCEHQIGTCYPNLLTFETYPPIQGQIQMPEERDIRIPIESDENLTSEEDQEIDQQECVRLIIPEDNRLPARNGKVCLPMGHEDRRRNKKKVTKDPDPDPCWCNCTIL